MAQKEFFSFDEALHELRLKEEELKRLVSEGEIRAFRDGETMKLRRADVDNLRTELSGGEVVDLGDDGEQLVFEDDEIAIGPQTTADDIEDWDSLTHIQLLVAIESAFGVRFNTGEMAGLANVGEMVELIRTKTA